MFELKLISNASDFKNKQLKVGSILSFFQDAAMLHAEQIGLGFKEMLEDKMLWVVLRIKFQIINPINQDDELFIYSWPEPRSRVEFGRSYVIKNKGKKFIIGKASWVTIDSEKRKILRASDVKRYDLVETNESILEPLKKLDHIDYSNMEKSFSYKVLESDIDKNGHLNNTRYAYIVFDKIDINGDILEGQIDFINEAKLNDMIDIYILKGNDFIKTCGVINDKISFELDIMLKEGD